MVALKEALRGVETARPQQLQTEIVKLRKVVLQWHHIEYYHTLWKENCKGWIEVVSQYKGAYPERELRIVRDLVVG